MAEAPNEASKNGPETWVIAAIAAAALLCVTLVAVALAAILGRGAGAGAPVNASPVINISTAAPAPAAAGIVRPSEPPKPQATRSSAQDQRQAALPGTQGKPGSEKIERADAQAQAGAAKLTLPSGAHSQGAAVRENGPSLYHGQGALPMPVRYRGPADGKVETLYLQRLTANQPLPPDQAYRAQSASGAQAELQLDDAHSTSALDGLAAPAGFVLFTGRLTVRNKADAPLPVDVDVLELRDGDGGAYVANTELSQGLPSAPLASGQSVEARIAVLVPASASLAALALKAPGGEIVLPLARQ